MLLAAAYPTAVFANPGLQVSNMILVTDVSPGQMLSFKIGVSIGDIDPAAEIAVQVEGMNQSLDGNNSPMADTAETSPYSARSYIAVDKSSFHLEPGSSQVVTATISIPEDVDDGGRYAMLHIATRPDPGSDVNILSAVDVPIVLTIKGSKLVHTGQITLTTGQAMESRQIDITTTFKNTGNHHFKIKGEVIISDSQGNVLATIPEALTTSSLIPGMSRQIKATFTPEKELLPGTYSIKSRVMLEDGTLLDEAEGSFQIDTPFMPPISANATPYPSSIDVPKPSDTPLVPVSITLKPSLAANLTAADGSISIYFPQGSVTNEADVTLQDYPVDQLPTPPSGYKPAVTCFKVDGLNGLLIKPATVTVKYNSSDLEKASGDASKLFLSRWDETNSQWTLLNTKLDKDNMTLTANTNQFSLWAVMVGPAASPINWSLIGTVGGIVVIILAAITIVISKRKRRQP